MKKTGLETQIAYINIELKIVGKKRSVEVCVGEKEEGKCK